MVRSNSVVVRDLILGGGQEATGGGEREEKGKKLGRERLLILFGFTIDPTFSLLVPQSNTKR
jgi:hypothetical protein